MDADEIKQLQRQVSKLQLEAKLRKSVANELERQKNLVQKARDEAEEQRAKFERASERLSQYLSHQMCEQILGSEEFSGLETNKKNLTIFFSDIVDFTALSERMSPDELKNFLHFYMTEMSSSVEYDFQVRNNWRAALFYDGGNAFVSQEFDWAQSVGIGVRWLSPIGPIRADIAHALSDEGGFRSFGKWGA